MKRKAKVFIFFIVLGLIFTSIMSATAEQKLDINTASVEQLQTLPGIGSVIAQNIVNYRQTHGAFEKIEDIMKIKGIGQKKFEKIKDLITVKKEKTVNFKIAIINPFLPCLTFFLSRQNYVEHHIFKS